VTHTRFAFESLQHDAANALGFASEGPFANSARARGHVRYHALTAYGRCLRPALYSSLRSSPSHPTGVSALRVTIAIASARFARKQWGVASTESLLAWKLGPGESATEQGKIKRTGVRARATLQSSTSACLHIGFSKYHGWR
jgi:hypothetical protein